MEDNLRNFHEEKKISIIITDKNDFNEIIERIFLKNTSGNYTTLIKDIDFINSLFEYLFNCEDEIKIQILNHIKFFIESNLNNCEIFNRCSANIKNEKVPFSLILLKIFINSDNEKIQKSIKEIFEILINNVNIKAFNYEYVSQEISFYFRQNEVKITEIKMDKYIDILKILYGERINPNKPKNYFYFSAKGSIKVNTKYLENERIKIINGCVISLWFQQESIANSESNNTSELFTMTLRNMQKLQLILNNNNLILKNIHQNNEFIHSFPEGWNNFTLIVKPKTLIRDTELQFIFKDSSKFIRVSDFTCESDIFEINFFKDFLGQVSTIIFLNKSLNEETLNILKNFKYGFYSETKLNEFIKIGIPSYLTTSNYIFKNRKYSPKEIENVHIILETLKFMYIPSRYFDKENIIYDVCGIFHADLVTRNCLIGLHSNDRLQYNIDSIGGINNLLPIFELCYSNKCLNEKIITSLFEIIYYILHLKKINMKNALDTNFFRILSIFLEKFSSEIFSKNLMNLFLNICKSLFSSNHMLSIQYTEHILLNQKILIKFSISLQIVLWMNLYQFYITDISKINTFMELKNLIILLRFYDQNKFQLFCCVNHANQIDGKFDHIKIMDPPLNNIIEYLIKITKLVIDDSLHISPDNLTILVTILNLDFSPCIIKSIIEIMINFFKNKKFNIDIQKNVLLKLINDEMIDKVLFSYSLSLLDVRIDIIKLFQLISCPSFKDTLGTSNIKKIHIFLKENLLPTNIKIKSKELEIECPGRERSNGVVIKSDNNIFFRSKKNTTVFYDRKKVNAFSDISTELYNSNVDIIKKVLLKNS